MYEILSNQGLQIAAFLLYKSHLHLVRHLPSGIEQHPCIWAHPALVECSSHWGIKGRVRVRNWVCVPWLCVVANPLVVQGWWKFGDLAWGRGGEVGMARGVPTLYQEDEKVWWDEKASGPGEPGTWITEASLGSIPCDSSREVGGRCYLYRIAPNDANHHPSSSLPLFFFFLIWVKPATDITSSGLVAGFIVEDWSALLSFALQISVCSFKEGKVVEHRVWRAACKDLHLKSQCQTTSRWWGHDLPRMKWQAGLPALRECQA